MAISHPLERPTAVCGLANLGNSCYANAIIQVMANQRAFVHALVEGDGAIGGRESPTAEATSLRSFRRLVERMEKESAGYVKPSRFLQDAIALSPCDFSVNQQGDACELLLLLLSKWEESFGRVVCLDTIYSSGAGDARRVRAGWTDGLLVVRLYKAREELLQLEGYDRSQLAHLTQVLREAARHARLPDDGIASLWHNFPRLLSHRKNIISELFQGCTVSTLSCVTCRFVRILHPEEFLVLSLPISDGRDVVQETLFERCTKFMHGPEAHPRHVSLMDCMRDHCTSSISHFEGSGPTCPSCKQPQERVEQRTLFLRLPDILCISLKRFRFDGSWMSSKLGGNKISSFVDCPLQLDLAEFCASVEYLPGDGADVDGMARGPLGGHRYTLDAVVNHHGFSLLKGHYTSYAYKADLEKWALFNDHHVGEVTADEVLASEVYIAVYRRDSIGAAAPPDAESVDHPPKCTKVIRLSPSLHVDIVDSHETASSGFPSNAEFASGMKLLQDICQYLNTPEDPERPEDIEEMFSSTTARPTTAGGVARSSKYQLRSLPKSFSETTTEISSERRLLSIDWVRRSQWLTDPGPITNLPCYCCPRPSKQPLGEDSRSVSPPAEESVSQVDRIFSNLCENLKIDGLSPSKNPIKLPPRFHRYFDGATASCHGKTVSETYVDVSVDLYRKLRDLFGGGPELLPSDLSCMCGS